jgi:ribosomal protein S18 acetylase RimI-like enzyme
MARGELADEVIVLRDGHTVIGWAARGGHDDAERMLQADPARPDAIAKLISWIGDGYLEVFDGDDVVAAALIASGFAPRADGRSVGMFRSTDLATAPPPEGYTMRAVRDDERDGRVAVHRAAWKPATLPYADGRAADPNAESSFTTAAYDAVRATWLYDPGLDLVAEAPDGSLAGCCILWLDPATGVAELEPMGVAPEHRNRGVAVALCHEASRCVSERGGTEIFINTGPRDEYPAPAGAYRKAGFVEVERATIYARART